MALRRYNSRPIRQAKIAARLMATVVVIFSVLVIFAATSHSGGGGSPCIFVSI